uniref:Uncharacterized protein n=1 Tax=Helianthus annuus TaxID=4232 RepID=A0A251RXL1_HELAN
MLLNFKLGGEYVLLALVKVKVGLIVKEICLIVLRNQVESLRFVKSLFLLLLNNMLSQHLCFLVII